MPEDGYGSLPWPATEVAGGGGLYEGAGSDAPIPRGQAAWQTLALLANHILSESLWILGDGLLEIPDS